MEIWKNIYVVPTAQIRVIAFDVHGAAGFYYFIMVVIPFRVYMTDELAGFYPQDIFGFVTSVAFKTPVDLAGDVIHRSAILIIDNFRQSKAILTVFK